MVDWADGLVVVDTDPMIDFLRGSEPERQGLYA
jgi:hypothetical protein